ncbi:MAG: 5-formyltetrahydrofolate cyclo-ligase [Chthoniobacterales bacterium]|nr:5-formyltetrahydrofolate cyclo-ligase [Chthoniobacterales bacterium]
MNTKEAKRSLRTQIRKLLAEIPTAQKIQQSGQICNLLLTYLRPKNFRRIFAFWPMAFEPQIQPALHTLIKDNGIFLPAFSSNNSPEFRLWNGDESQLEKNSFGFLAPPEKTVLSWPENDDILLVPGLAFTPDGSRLGQGKGFYDQVLQYTNSKMIFSLGICFREQIFDRLPIEDHDAKVNEIIWNL